MGLLEIPCMCDSSTKLRVLISQSQARSCKEGQTKFKMFTMENLPLPGSAGKCRCPWRSWWWSWSRSAETPPEEIQGWKREIQSPDLISYIAQFQGVASAVGVEVFGYPLPEPLLLHGGVVQWDLNLLKKRVNGWLVQYRVNLIIEYSARWTVLYFLPCSCNRVVTKLISAQSWC